MGLDNLAVLAKNLYYGYPLLSLGAMISLAVFAFVRPKVAARAVALVLAFSLVIYCFSVLGKSSSTGLADKDRMINQTVRKTE